MLLVIEEILSRDELARVRAHFDRANFGDGRVTAGNLAAKVKNNLQLGFETKESRWLSGIVQRALERNPQFVSAALPKTVCMPLFNRYLPGMEFGVHVDNAIRIADVTLRTDLSGTLFLNDPEDYEGGELMIEDTFGTQSIKLAAGSLVLYPSSSLHRIERVTAGHRDVAVFWVQSAVRETEQRRLLFQLDRDIQGLSERLPDAPEIRSLVAAYHNLLRMWADI